MPLEDRRVLYISYNGMLDPLGQSQVIPYLQELAARGLHFTLLSFERAHAFELGGVARCEELRDRLASSNIEWHWLPYHQNPSLPATIYDVLAGTRYAARLVRKNAIEIVHARSHIAATIALALKKRFRLKMIFDVRGLMAEEYVEAGHWRKGGIPYRLTKNTERRVLAASDGVVTLTEKIWPLIQQTEALRDRRVVHEVVPCCADLNRYRFCPDDRRRRRQELGLGDRFTIVYSGSIGSWYLSDKLADFFVQFLNRRPESHFLWLTGGNPESIRKLMYERSIEAEQYSLLSVASEEVPSYLSASDLSVAFYKPGLSKLATSPVKVTEYLACGLPLIINAGIGDLDSLIAGKQIGAVVAEFTPIEYEKAIKIIDHLVEDPESTRQRARSVAEKYFDLRKVGAEGYTRVYQRILDLQESEG